MSTENIRIENRAMLDQQFAQLREELKHLGPSVATLLLLALQEKCESSDPLEVLTARLALLSLSVAVNEVVGCIEDSDQI